jgi:hypothetical protein
MILTGESISTARETCIISTLFTRNSDGMAGDRTDVHAVRGRRLTAWAVVGLTNLTNFTYRFSWKVGASTSWNPQGAVQTCTAIALFHTKHLDFPLQRLNCSCCVFLSHTKHTHALRTKRYGVFWTLRVWSMQQLLPREKLFVVMSLWRGCVFPRRQVDAATVFFFVVTSDICGSKIWTWFMPPFWRLEFWGGF